MFRREDTRAVRVGPLTIGGGAPVIVQSMTCSDTRDAVATLEQIRRLAEAGCELVRVAVPDLEAAEALAVITKDSPLPVVADIHFDYRLAIEAVKAGVDKIRVNPGNIGGEERVKAVAAACQERGIPIRIGVNAGSLEAGLRERYGGPTPEALVESAAHEAAQLEAAGFHDIVISLKASDVPIAIKAYLLAAERFAYPLHVGITEAGLPKTGAIRSAVGIGAILNHGIGDTIRVSLTGDPCEEVPVAWEILRSLNLRQRGPTVISCPTCGRCGISLKAVAEEVEARLGGVTTPIKVAVMGCAVNGPGEAREADVGLAGGKEAGLIFRNGEIIRKVPGDMLVDALMEEVGRVLDEKGESGLRARETGRNDR